MNFHDIKMGHTFFEHQFPQLIQSIQALTAALDRSTQMVTLPVEADPEFLSDLYDGNYEAAIFVATPESREYTRAINAARDELTALLSEEGLAKLEAYTQTLSRRDDADMERAYESGFRTAVQMIVAGLARPGQANGAA